MRTLGKRQTTIGSPSTAKHNAAAPRTSRMRKCPVGKTRSARRQAAHARSTIPASNPCGRPIRKAVRISSSPSMATIPNSRPAPPPVCQTARQRRAQPQCRGHRKNLRQSTFKDFHDAMSRFNHRLAFATNTAAFRQFESPNPGSRSRTWNPNGSARNMPVTEVRNISICHVDFASHHSGTSSDEFSSTTADTCFPNWN
jgi:hypothetical protein